MASPVLIAAIVLIVLHNVDGDEVMVNAEQIVTLMHTREAKGGSNQLIVSGPKCVIGLANGKFISVIEDCGMVRQALRQAQ